MKHASSVKMKSAACHVNERTVGCILVIVRSFCAVYDKILYGQRTAAADPKKVARISFIFSESEDMIGSQTFKGDRIGYIDLGQYGETSGYLNKGILGIERTQKLPLS